MRTRPSLIYMALLPIGATTAFLATRGVPLSHWIDAWPILPFIGTAAGCLYITVRDASALSSSQRNATTGTPSSEA